MYICDKINKSARQRGTVISCYHNGDVFGSIGCFRFLESILRRKAGKTSAEQSLWRRVRRRFFRWVRRRHRSRFKTCFDRRGGRNGFLRVYGRFRRKRKINFNLLLFRRESGIDWLHARDRFNCGLSDACNE